jgi:hypothetical protein
MKSMRMRWTGYVARIRIKRNAYIISVGKPDGKKPLGRPKRRWVDTTEMDLRVIKLLKANQNENEHSKLQFFSLSRNLHTPAILFSFFPAKLRILRKCVNLHQYTITYPITVYCVPFVFPDFRKWCSV